MSAAKRSARPADLEYILKRGVIEIIPEQDFVQALEAGKKLRLKFGLDPSKPDLHIGHGVLLRKLRRLQDMGHQVVLIVGDWTAQIGDPSGQSIMRPMLTADEVRANAETYMRQFFHVVDRDKTEVRWQSEWFGKFTLDDIMRLAARFTVAQMLQREDFRERYDAGKPLGIHELFYPLLQAYDSVAIEADVEFGGSDQRFNLLVGRELQAEMGQTPQACFIMNLLVGTDGSAKMSKTVGNTIDFEDAPNEKYGKTMSLPDSALPEYLELATDISDEELAYLRKQLEDRGGTGGSAQQSQAIAAVNPMEIKKRLAREIVGQFDGGAAAQEAEAEFERTFQKGEEPGEVKEFAVRSKNGKLVVDVTAILVESELASSKTEARRLLRQGAVELDERRITPEEATSVEAKAGALLRVGKHRFLRIVDAGDG